MSKKVKMGKLQRTITVKEGKKNFVQSSLKSHPLWVTLYLM